MITETILIENVPQDLAKQIKLLADQHGRSVSDEALELLKDKIRPVRGLKFPDKLIPTLQPITTEMVIEGIREGRK